jgi:tripartite-type tricarboxylate transporter receptor subunit TctC
MGSNSLRQTSIRARRRLMMLGVALMGFSTVLIQTPARAEQAYPTKPIRLVVSYGAGNVTDLLARVIAEKLTQKWGQSVIVENRPGQGGSFGAALVAKAPADGYTLVFSAMAALAINPHVYGSVGFNTLKDFVPIVNVAYPDLAVVIDPALKIPSFKALVDYSKAHPTALNYGSPGSGTVPHLNVESLKLRTGLIAQHIPYKSAEAVSTDVIGHRVQIQMETLSVLMPLIKGGRLQPIAVGTEKRVAELPDVPTLAELVPGFSTAVPWLGLLAPAGTPAPIVTKINQDVVEILKQPDVQRKLLAYDLTIVGSTPAGFAKTVAGDYERFGKLVKQLGIKAD